MVPDNNDSLVDKLQKILALTSSPSEGEAAAATAMLQKLLTKHNLSIADLEKKGQAAPGIERIYEDLGKSKHEFKLDLADALAKHFFCYPIINYTSKTVVFIGRPDNVESLQMLYRWLIRQIWNISSEEKKQHPEIPGVRWHKAFGEGIVQRLGDRLYEIRKQEIEVSPQEQALVVHHMSEVGDWMEENLGWRGDGQKTKAQQERAAHLAHLKETDLEAYYKERPWERPISPEEQARRDEVARKEEEARAKREERRRQNPPKYKARSWEEMEADDHKWTARVAGREAGDRVNLQPFIGQSTTEVKKVAG